MSHLEEVTKVSPLAGYKLELRFKSGDHRVFDCSPYLNKGLFQALQNEAVFRQVKLCGGSVAWPGGLDLSPETLFDRSNPI
jgi:hypothetical protein